MKMNFEQPEQVPKKTEKNTNVSGKTMAYAAAGVLGVFGAATSPIIGKEVKEIFTGKELLTPENVSYEPKNQDSRDSGSIKVVIDGEQVASLEAPNENGESGIDDE